MESNSTTQMSAHPVTYYLSRGRNQVTIKFVPIKVSLPILVTSGVIILLSLILCCYLKSLQRKIRVEQGYKVAAYKPRKSVTCEACAICLEDFEPMEKIVVSRCQHTYHNKCLERWLEVKNSCPICLTTIKKITTRDSAAPSHNCSTMLAPPQHTTTNGTDVVPISLSPPPVHEREAIVVPSSTSTQQLTSPGCSYLDFATSSYSTTLGGGVGPPLVKVLMPTVNKMSPKSGGGGQQAAQASTLVTQCSKREDGSSNVIIIPPPPQTKSTPNVNNALRERPVVGPQGPLAKILRPGSWNNNNYATPLPTYHCSRNKGAIVKVFMPPPQPILRPLLRVEGHTSPTPFICQSRPPGFPNILFHNIK